MCNIQYSLFRECSIQYSIYRECTFFIIHRMRIMYNIQYSVFFYGTLRSSQVREAVLGKDISTKMMDTATLKKYKVFKVKDAHYPLIKYTNNEKDIVDGIIAKNLTYEQLITLDKFEGENYFRQFIKVHTNNNILDSQIYLPKTNLISSEPWDYDDWYKNDMKKFFENEFDLNGVKWVKLEFRYFLIFVFDPLAVLLLIAANISLRQWQQKRIFIKTSKKRDLQKRIEALQQKNKKLRIYKDLTRDLGDNPDEIKLKLNQIYDWNEQK